jgi:stage VI sporulation protein D
VSDQLNGLRFDIYERVHLPDDVVAIEELEEVELVPHMQVLPQEDQVLLRGHLLLSGVYRSQESSEVSQLEHWIPVEISLPLNRIQSVDQLAVEIDNFDVDLLSSRSLNVTGVLALRGLQVHAYQEQQAPIWRDDSFTVVHQTEPELAAPLSIEYAQTEYLEVDEPERIDDWSLQAETEELPLEAAKESSWLAMFQNLENSRQDQEASDDLFAEEKAALVEAQWGDVSTERDDSVGMNAPSMNFNEEDNPMLDNLILDHPILDNPVPDNLIADSSVLEFAHLPEETIEDRQDLKVALGGKPLDSVQSQQFGVGLLSQLGEKGAKREADLRLLEAAQAEEKVLAASQSNASTGDELEWTRLFLNNGTEAHSFRKVKMCIVQREDTLELIATRYQIQPRELQLYNRLHDPYLSEGQVIYIP